MKRRTWLTSASALAGVALTGCGGGEEAALDGDPSSEIAAYKIPRYLVPANGRYQVEVVFATTRKVRVGFINSASSSHRGYWSKEVTKGTSHKVGFALWRCNASAGVKYTDWYLQVTEGTSGPVISAGTANTVPDDFRRYQVFNDGGTEYEWAFYSKTDGTLLAFVRFFPIPLGDPIDFKTNEYVMVINNTATHQNSGGLTVASPKQFATPYQLFDSEISVIADTGNKKDTLCLPNNRRPGHDELVPSYLAASKAERPVLNRRLLRHFHRFGNKAREKYTMESAHNVEVFNMLGNELARTLGGASLINHLNDVRGRVATLLTDNVEQMGSKLYQLCASRLPALSSAEMINSTRQLLDRVVTDQASSKVAGGGTVSTSLQFDVIVDKMDFLPGSNLSYSSVRLSLGMARMSQKWAGGVVSPINSYTVANLPTAGLKLGCFFILHGFAGSRCKIGGHTVCVRVNLNFTVRNGVWRVDFIQLEPEINFDSPFNSFVTYVGPFDEQVRSFLGGLAARGLKQQLAPAGGAGAAPALNMSMSYTTPAYMSDMTKKIRGFAGYLADTGVGLEKTSFEPGLNPLLKSVEAGASPGANFTSELTFGNSRISVLRSVIPNSDVNNPAIPFRGGFYHGGTGWQPAVTHTEGWESKPNYFVGGTYYPGWARLVSVADSYALYGTPDFMRAAAFHWSL